ncbi:MAG: hypothetical protein P4L46_17870 [Fimbriimonas sp.]|nr:hypothetical protein [Fimbriimonas sp.]
MNTRVALACILRCVYACGGHDGQIASVNQASKAARTDPSGLTGDALELLSETPIGYFYEDELSFVENRTHVWFRLSASIRNLPETAPPWFVPESMLSDLFPNCQSSLFLETKPGFLWIGI